MYLHSVPFKCSISTERKRGVWWMGCIIESIFSTRFHNCAFTFHFSKEMGHDPSDTCYQASAIRKTVAFVGQPISDLYIDLRPMLNLG